MREFNLSFIFFSAFSSILFLSAIYGATAQAALGEKISNLDSHQSPMAGQQKVFRGQKYHTLTTQSADIVLREYVTTSGEVFAVTWLGGHAPDLAPIFGEHFNAFSAEQKQASRKRFRQAAQRIETSDLVVERYGHLRQLGGRAYLKSKVPQGVEVNALN